MSLIGVISDSYPVIAQPEIIDFSWQGIFNTPKTFFAENELIGAKEIGEFASLEDAARFVLQREPNYIWKVKC